MTQQFETYVPSLKHQKLLKMAEEQTLLREKEHDKKLLSQATNEVISYFEKFRYWWINDHEMIFDRETGLLWQGQPDLSKKFNYHEQDKANLYLNSLKLGGINGWRTPLDKEFKGIVQPKNFPLKLGDYFYILDRTYWLTQDNRVCNLGGSSTNNSAWSDALVLGVSPLFKNKQSSKIVIDTFVEKKWNIKPFDPELSNDKKQEIWKIVETAGAADIFNYKSDNIVKDSYMLSFLFENYDEDWQEDLTWLDAFKQINQILITEENDRLDTFRTSWTHIQRISKKKYTEKLDITIQEIWKNIDYIGSRLPILDNLRFTDVDQGIWEFYAPKNLKAKYTKINTATYCRERNPVLDIQEANVAIDFGTSSTVVAIRKNGRDELLRIGMQAEHFKKTVINDQQYENPTVLEFLDIQSFLQDWKSESYRPLVNWNDIHCSHEARSAQRKADSDTKIISSIFARLKQWALRDTEHAKVRFRDQQGYEYQLQPLTEHNPVKGQEISINDQYPELDPIELYAWFLGMNINWRERGIFLNYYLTFPVKYSNEVKAKILASFRRGLLRSLPEALIHDERINDFSVEELASEPAAFAAAALERLSIEPDQDGTSYAVFDFGGGTTDFDYGLYRLPNEEEEEDNWDHVIEHFGSSGDQFLGGENLLENLAYLVFQEQKNKEECLKHNISFTKPLDAESFAGSEILIAQTQAAYTNTTLMMSKLRPLWESGQIDLDSKGTETFKLINKSSEAVDCEIVIKQDVLINFLEQRIRKGLREFFIAMKIAFEQKAQMTPRLIHVLLAGNSSRSRIVLGLLGRLEDEKSKTLHDLLLSDLGEIFEDFQELEIHLPLDADLNNPYAATAKTGVALGLLRLCPGETLKVINHALTENLDSPFPYYIGAFKRDILKVSIFNGQKYEEWVELGKPMNGVFIMGYTTSASAAIEKQIKRRDEGVFEQNIRLSGNLTGHKVFARVRSPSEIEICTAINIEALDSNQYSNSRIINLM